MRRLLRMCALISLVSVSLNTTRTFERYEYLFYVTFVCDIVVTVLFTIEMIMKMYIRGFLMVRLSLSITFLFVLHICTIYILMFFSFHCCLFPDWFLLFKRPLVSIWCYNGFLFVDICYIAGMVKGNFLLSMYLSLSY